jgi:hypothetical protein
MTGRNARTSNHQNQKIERYRVSGADYPTSKSQFPRAKAPRVREFARACHDGQIAIGRRAAVDFVLATARSLANCKGFVREIWGRAMRAGVVACAGLALALAGCNLTLEEKLIQEGIGTELAAADIVESTRRLEVYLSYLCVQAGGTTVVADAADTIVSCDTTRYGNAQWSALVRAGFNDIDRRCDAYLAWLASRRRDRSAILSQIHDTRTFTEALLYTTGVGAAPIAIAGLAFGLASNSFTNYYSRLLFEIEKSTVSLLVREKRLQYRNTLNVRIAFQPDAVHVLREYMLICTPFYIEDLVNQRTRDSISGNTPADKGNAEQIRRSLVAGALISSIPSGGPRGDLPGVAGQPGGPPRPTTMGQPSTEVERQLPKAMGQMLQANLCAEASGSFDTATREAIRQAKVGANMSRVARRTEPLFKPVNDELRNASEVQIFLDARNCRNDSSGVDRGYVTAFEKFRFPDEIAIKSFQTALAGCDQNVKPTGIFDGPTRTGISTATGKTGSPVPKTDRLTPKAYEWVSGVCL